MAQFPPNLDDGERWIPSNILLSDPPVPAAFPPSLGGHALSLGARRFPAADLPSSSRPKPAPPSPYLVPQQRFRAIYRGQFQPPIYVRSWNGFRPASPVSPSSAIIPNRAVPSQVMENGYHRPRRPLVVHDSNFWGVGTGVFIPRVAADDNHRMKQGILEAVERENMNKLWRSRRMRFKARAAVWEMEELPIEDVLPSEWTY